LVIDEITEERGRNSIQLSSFPNTAHIGKSKERSAKSRGEAVKQTKTLLYEFVSYCSWSFHTK